VKSLVREGVGVNNTGLAVGGEELLGSGEKLRPWEGLPEGESVGVREETREALEATLKVLKTEGSTVRVRVAFRTSVSVGVGEAPSVPE
jgi:hypothetical protein